MTTPNKPNNLEMIWAGMADTIRDSGTLSKPAFSLWFEDMTLESVDADKAVFSTSNTMKKNIVSGRYTDLLGDTIAQYIGYRPEIEIISRDDPPPEYENAGTFRSPLVLAQQMRAEREEKERRAAALAEEEAAMLPDYTFDNFIVGQSNKFAHAAALAVGENPGTAYNPLFIYGPSGLGKTHLMYAIAHRIKEKNPDARIIYAKGDEFTNQLIDAIQEHSTALFREKYRKADVLLIDDIQFIAGKTSTQEEFFHTFNSLHSYHKQIIVTSDRPPRELSTLEERIRSRFEAGLLADIGLPDYELRLAILRKKAEAMNLRIPEESAIFLAENLHSNVRQIEGVVKKLSAMQFLSEQPVTVSYIRAAAGEYLKDSEPTQDVVNRIISVTARHFGVTEEAILGKSRQKEIKTARNVAMYIIREQTDLSLTEIGVMLNRDHSTVHSNITAVEAALRSDSFLDADVSEIRKELRS